MGRLTTFGSGSNLYNFAASHVHQQSLQVNFGGRVRASERMVMTSGGFDKYGISASPSEVGAIQLQVKLYANNRNEMEDYREALAAIQGYGLTILKYQETDSAQEEKFCFARCTNVSIPQDQKGHSDLIQQATISFEVPHPIWHTTGKAAPLWGGFVWGGAAWGGSPDTINVSGTQTNGATTNNGTAVVLPILTLSCGASQTCENPVIQRIVNGAVVDEFSYTGVIGNNEVLTINCRKKSVDLDGTDVIANVDFRHGAWFRIAAGANTIRVNFDNPSDAASLKIQYYEDFYGA